MFTPGNVCVFDLLQELEVTVPAYQPVRPSEGQIKPGGKHTAEEEEKEEEEAPSLAAGTASPNWALSAPITEKKSKFLGRACAITSAAHAQACIADLLRVDKRASKATHNISAYRLSGGRRIATMMGKRRRGEGCYI